MAHSAIGIDIGGGHCRAALVSRAGDVLRFAECPTPHDAGADALAAAVARLVDTLARESGEEAPPQSPAAVGVALPGFYDPRTGVMASAVNLPFLTGVNVRDLLASALRRPVLIESDVCAAGWAQFLRLPLRPQRMLYLSLGTGVGGCVIIDGCLLRALRGFGHMVVDQMPDAPLCRCGARGCLEAIASGPAVDEARAAAARRGAPFDSTRVAGALAFACRQLAVLISPNVILLGGGVIDAHCRETPSNDGALGAALLDRVARAVAADSSSVMPRELAITCAPLLSREAGAVGAALRAME